MKTFLTKSTNSHLLSKIPLIFLLYFIILQHLVRARVAGRVHHLGNETDHAALLMIKSQLIDHTGGVFTSWNHSIHHCHWDGITCGPIHNRVIILNLKSRGLGGTISPFIGNLSFLQNLELYNNSLVGAIPPELGRLFRVQVIGLLNNTLDGYIPANLSACINLRRISIANNKLRGNLPSEFRALSKLTYLDVSGNYLTGPLFNVIANLSSLKTLGASSNFFIGNIPTSIGDMQNLTFLLVESNNLTGTIPTSILKCSMLTHLDVGYNKLHGELPPNIGHILSHLTVLELGENKFSGVFPNSILNLTTIGFLDIHSNNFVGKIPHNFGHLQNLYLLDLGLNNFEGDINFVDSLVNCTKLQTLQLDGNKFTGILPESVASLSTSLFVFLLAQNQISGEFPAGVTNLINLQIINFNGNKFTGSIPPNLAKLQYLNYLDVSSNLLTGSIPDSFGNLPLLSTLYLDDNQFEGSVPLSLGRCKSLLDLDLSSNKLNGTLGDGLFNGFAQFIIIDLSDNHLEGSIPQEISRQINLVEFHVFENKLSGDIPFGLGDCYALQILDMHDNFLHGVIPLSFKSLGSLQIFDISKNYFSGLIPEYFSKFPLQLLNLSYNNFEGEVPINGVFANISAIAIKENTNLCGGVPKLHLRRCTQGKGIKKRRKFSHASKLIIAIVCALFGLLVVIIWLYLTYHRKKTVPTSSSSSTETVTNVSYDKLMKATNNFSSNDLIGAGSFASVFRGSLNGKVVAVKVINLQTRGATKSFIAECKALRNLRHRNLVGVITACSSIDFKRNDFKALVYEYMPNESLDKWLHGNGVEKLTLVQRVDIAIDVAHALSYLHNDYEIPVVHCDLKPSNILLDNDMVARVGDFGLTKFLSQPRHLNQSSSIEILGTIGYVAPEYGLGSEFSKDGDVYSYGILLLELMTGKRPTDEMFNQGYNIQTYVQATLPDNILPIIDPFLGDNETEADVDDIRSLQIIDQRRIECIVSVIRIGLTCSKHLPQDRMKISDAIGMLQVAREHLHVPRKRQ